MPSQRPNDPANCDQGSRNYPVGEGARPVVEPMTLAQQIAHLRQLAIADPNTTLLELAIINVLDELAEAVQNLAGNKPRGLGSIWAMDSDLEHALVVLRYWFGPDLARDLNVTPHDCRDVGILRAAEFG
jgi:hypothetical protein